MEQSISKTEHASKRTLKTAGGTSIYAARHNDCKIILTKLQTIKRQKEAVDYSKDTLLMPDMMKLQTGQIFIN